MQKYTQSRLSDCHCEPTYFSYPDNKRYVETNPFVTVNGNVCYGMYFPKKRLTKDEKVEMKKKGKVFICRICGEPCKRLKFFNYAKLDRN